MFSVRAAQSGDLKSILNLENSIEGPNAASENTLRARQDMFADGFRVVMHDQDVISYVQSCVWRRPAFETFDEIADFPSLHDNQGNELYVIFLATSPQWRKQGAASLLLASLKDIAYERDLHSISLVAKDSLIGMYEKAGFKAEKPLPHFLPQTDHTLMSWKKDKTL